ncbi:MAG: lipid-A-disaccharide synthase-related protein [Candidatus Eremiobacteraeota bacterium]|nr:lipid-A-disaccharide synthase-related protein [Candidatus Eremiobacteraeota bacterium]
MSKESENIIFLSNGYGEDTIASAIMRELFKLRPGLPVMAFPLVGAGVQYKDLPVDLCGPREVMPSEGMVPESLGNLLDDIRGGLVSLTIKQLRELGRLRKKIRLCIAVGDLIPVMFSIIGLRKSPVFIGTAKSDYFVPYSWFERFILKRWCLLTLTRDQITADSLGRYGINAIWLGNAMMDALEFVGEDFRASGDILNLALLPGSRGGVVDNFKFMLGVLDKIMSRNSMAIQGLVALAPSCRVDDFINAGLSSGWVEDRIEKNDHRLGKISKDNHTILFLRGCFGDLLSSSDLILGQGGTANEQAAGLQKPVVAFEPGGEENLKWYRKRQKGLLGEALIVVDKNEGLVADKLLSLIASPETREKMAKIGKERMGPLGGSIRMARTILDIYDREVEKSAGKSRQNDRKRG